ncbi:MAG: hypothetical protein ACRC6E_11145, partial [Fusobacteriaceae bacterium]
MKNLNEIREALKGYNMNMWTLDNEMVELGFYSNIEETKYILESESAVYTSVESNQEQIIIDFKIVYRN